VISQAMDQRSPVLYLLKNPFLLRQLMLRQPTDTLLGDDIGAADTLTFW
jgi:hypothetical protein